MPVLLTSWDAQRSHHALPWRPLGPAMLSQQEEVWVLGSQHLQLQTD